MFENATHRSTGIDPSEQQRSRATFLATHDVDYADAFQAAAHVNRLIELRGATTGRLLRRSTLYHALGDYARSVEDAARIVAIDPQSDEGYFRLGAARLALALQRLHRLPLGPGTARRRARQRPSHLLRQARDAFDRAHQLNPRDEEARQASATTETLLSSLQDAGAKKWREPYDPT